MSISRDVASLMLNEADERSVGSCLTLEATDLQTLADEWNDRRPDSVAVAIEPPYDIPSILITDPFGNRMDFQQPLDAAELEAREERAVRMRDFIRQRIEAGDPCPAPQQVVDAIGHPLGLAIQILSEFSEYPSSSGT